jgi:gliding motility-associated-like protein
MKIKLLSLLVSGLIGILCTTYSFSQGADTPAGATGVPVSIPFSAAGTTVGAANNVDSDPTAGVVTIDGGNDWFYYFCATTTGVVNITLTYNGSAVPQIFPSLQVFNEVGLTTYAGTPGNAAASQTATASTANLANTIGVPLAVTAGSCYYVMIDNSNYNTSSFAYNLQMTYATTTTTPPTQPGCTNMGFDNGTTSGWVGNWGHTVVNGGMGAPTPTYTPVYGTLNQGHHNVTTAGLDPFTGAVQQVCPLIPSNVSSMRLGDGPNGSFGGAQLMQKFSVTSANALLTYYYAAIMQDAGADHQNYEQPFFKIEALDCSGNPIACGNYLVTGGPGIPGFIQIGTSTVYYKDWTPVLLDLTPYIGSCVTIRFTIGDCSRGAHFAYAYLDATCGPVEIIAPATVCQNTSTTFTAPTGAATYSWVNTAAPGTVLGTTNVLTVAPSTTGTVTYQCTMTSVSGCNTTISSTVNVLPTPQITVTNPPAVCAPNAVDITAASVVTITSGSGTISYYSDAACTIPIASPGAITVSGTYYIKILNANGCFDIRPVTVVVNPTPTVNVTTADQTICLGQSVNLAATISPAASNTPVTFTNTADFPIPDGIGAGVGPTVSSPITVSGINPQTVGVLPIVSVNVSLTHTYDQDVQMYLQCPGGTTIQLSTGNGGAGANYTNTTFVPTGSPSIVGGTAPFTGSFTPEQAFSLLNACAVNGTWNLVLQDDFQGDIGTILGWSITFNTYTPAPTFAWSPTANMTNSTTLTPTVTPTATTTYTFTGTSSTGGCTASDPITITVNPIPTATISGTTSVCQNAASPTITFTGSNGTAPYVFTYNINGGANQTVSSGAGNTATVSAPTATVGTFTYNLVSVTSGGCPNPQTGSAIVTINPLPTGTISGTTSVCQNAASPNITFTGANATAPYTFTYNINGGANQTISSGAGTTATVSVPTTTAGTFTYNLVSVSSGNGCSQNQSGSAIVTVNPLPTATISGTTTICQNAAAPSITFTGANGVAPYTFTYNINGGANQTVSSGAGSTATVSVPTGASGTFTYNLVSVSSGSCSQSQTGSAVVTVNPLPTATISGATTVCQNAASPIITFTGANATAPYTFTYNINGGANQTVSSGAGSTATVSVPTTVVGTFTYNLVSVSSGNGCSQGQTGSAIVVVNPLPTATISGTTTVCQNATTPNITFTGANGTAPYTFTYNINGGANQTVSSGAGSTATVTAPTATAGTFTYNLISVSSANTCFQAQTGSAVVTVNLLPTATISGTTTICQNAASPNITFTGANGSIPYTFTYNINGGANQTVSSGAGSTATVSVPTGTAGSFTYNLVSVASGSCSQPQTGSAIVTINSLPTAIISGTTTVCQNDPNPTITFTGSNGTAPYTFTYNLNGGANQTISSGAGTTATISAPTTTAGTFTYNLVSVSSSTGCSQAQTGSAVVTVNLLPTGTISGTTTICQNAASPNITFTGANGSIPYTFTYNINGGANQTVSSGAGSTATVSVPTGTAGTFTYNLVSVASGSCSQPQTGSAIVTINPLPSATIAGTISVCQNDPNPTVTFTGSNGTAPYTFTYNLNGGASQTISSGAGTTATISVPTTTAGVFTYNLVSVSNTSGCSQAQTGSAVVTVNLLPTATISGATTVCQNATSPSITFTGTNGTIPYTFTYNINGGANQTVSSGAGSTATVSVSTATAGTFTYNLVNISSSGTCGQPQTGSAIVTVDPLPTATISGTTTVCQNDVNPVITFTGSNGTTPYTFTYNINGGANQTVSSGAGTSATVSVPTTTAGTFTYNLVSVSGANSCSQNQTGSAVVTVNLLPTATISGTTTVCQNDPAPNITFTGSNGVAPYTFTYNIDGGANQTISSGAGNTATISVPTGTLGTFTYNLISVASGLCSQNQTGSAVVTISGLPTAVISGTTTVCQNSVNPLITFTGANGSVPYTFTYNINGGANQTVSSGAGTTATVSVPTTTAGTFTYNLVSVASGSCSQLQAGSSTVIVNPLPTATISGTAAVCQNGATQVITFTGSNGTAPYTFTYNMNGGANQTIVSVGNTATVNAPTAAVGTFTYNLVSVSEAGGCSQTQTGSAVITVDPLPTATISGTSTVCQNGAAQTITFTGANGTAPYTFAYNLNGGGNQTIVSNAAGVATLTVNSATVGIFTYDLIDVTSSIGCSQAQIGTATVTVNGLPNASIAGTTSVCENDPSPVVTFTGSNDAPSYTFTYNLNGGANQTISSGAGNTATLNVPTTTAGTFTYNLISVVGNNGCSQASPGAVTVDVFASPTASISGATAICSGQTATLTITGTPNTTVTYTDGTTTGSLVLNASGSGTITTPVLTTSVTYTLQSVQTPAPANCSTTLTESATITVNPIPVADPIADIAVCVGSSVTVPGFNAAPAGSTFGWSNSNPAIGLGANGIGNIAAFNGQNPGTTSQTGTVSFAPTLNGCIGAVETFDITIYPLPIADAGLDVSSCQNNGTLVIGSTPIIGNTYSWSPATGLSSAVSSIPTVSTTTPGTTNYVVTVTSNEGCVSTDNVSVTVFATPTVSIIASATTGCAPAEISFTSVAPGSVNCVWDLEGIGIVTGCGTITETYNSPGQFGVSLTVTDNNGCTNTAASASDITIYPEVVAAFGVDAISHSMIDPTFQFLNNSTNATSYYWEFGDGTSSTSTNPSHTYPEVEVGYHVTLVASNPSGCNDTAQIMVSITPDLIFYVPNAFTPDGDENNNVFFPVFTTGFDRTSYTMYIFNRWGEIIFETHDLDFGWDGTYHDVLCQEGVYTWKIMIKERTVDKHHEYHGHVTLLK